MDMPINQINTRLFAQLPADPGLGLLFAVGAVSQIVQASGGKPIQFTLRHHGYALRCKVAPSVESAFDLADGQEVRATGHLSFSAQSARFHLLVRDLELLSLTTLPEKTTTPRHILASRKRSATPDWLVAVQRRAQAAAPVQLAPADIPLWVQEMAPPEVASPQVQRVDVRWGKQRAETAIEDEMASDEAGVTAFTRLDSDEQLLKYLLEVLERSENEDVELTAEVLAQFNSPDERDAGSPDERDAGSPDRQGADGPTEMVEPETPTDPVMAAEPPELLRFPSSPPPLLATTPVKWHDRPLWIVVLFLGLGTIIILFSLLSHFY